MVAISRSNRRGGRYPRRHGNARCADSPPRGLRLVLACLLPAVAAGSTAAPDARGERAAARAITSTRLDLGLPAGQLRLQPEFCRLQVRCPEAHHVACTAVGDYTQCEALHGNDGTLLGAVCLAHRPRADGTGQVIARQAHCHPP